MCLLYKQSLHYLIQQHYILSQSWMPSENMLVPLMMFLREVKKFDAISEVQRRFLEYWYWASVFANSYSTASNEVIIRDCTALSQVARDEPIAVRDYFTRLRPIVKESEDLFSYTKRTSIIYRGVLNLLGYEAKGLRDWNSTHIIDTSMQLEDHHIYPKAYINARPNLDLSSSEAEDLLDCVVNRTLIPKGLNVTVGKKPPHTYLMELQQKNPQLSNCLASHLITPELLNDPAWNEMFKLFLDERARSILTLIEKYAIQPAEEMVQRFGNPSIEPSARKLKPRLSEMLERGIIKPGEKVYVKKAPTRFATIIDGNTVEFEGEQMSINTWGQQLTGWSTINIYENVYLERTKQPIERLRGD